MALVPFEPFRQLESLREEMNRWMNHNFPSWAQQTFSFGPRVDVSQTDREVIVEAEIPGLTQEDELDIQVLPTQVVLTGEIRRTRKNQPGHLETSQQKEREPQNDNQPTEPDYYHTERYVGRFHRVISLPAEVDDAKASAEYENGVLEIRLPKVKAEKGKRLNVRFH